MTHRFPIKEIARQSGLSTATVDRVLNGRAHVSPQARARVAAALSELEGQEAQIAARGRKLFVDVVVEAPRRFSAKIRASSDACLSGVSGAVVRPRYTFAERMCGPDVVRHLDRIGRRGSGGVCLKARDLPEVRQAVLDLGRKGIPVVTLFTDVTETDRIGYAGLDNAAAGRTAAYLISLACVGEGTVLTTMSDTAFAGERARFQGFAAALAESAPTLRIADASGGGGLDGDTARRIRDVASAIPDLVAVYSMGGGNRAILKTLGALGHAPRLVLAHDLDADNRVLLAQRRIGVVLEHDIAKDMANAFSALVHWHGLTRGPPGSLTSDICILTPENMPSSDTLD